jgi:signal transduction histidine kinase
VVCHAALTLGEGIWTPLTNHGTSMPSRSPSVGDWLAKTEQKIVPPWISAVQRASLALEQRLPSGRKTRRMESAELLSFFDGVVTAVGEGVILKLDSALQSLVANRLGQGYSLTDFLGISSQLKASIWHVAKESLPPEKAIEHIVTVEPAFAHSTSRMAWLANRAAEAQREEELERLRRTVAALDRTKSDFINIAAHELKTPLTIIRGYSSILASELSTDPGFETVLQGMSTGIGRLQVLIQDMIDVSLIDSNVLDLALEAASLYEIARLAIDDLRAEALDRNLSIVMPEFPSQVDVMYLDSSRMYQVFTNILGNAIKFTPDGGSVAIDAQILADSESAREFVEVLVSDTGIGISAEDLPHIFRKFYRVGDVELHSTSKTAFRGGGPGLGLAIAKGIVEAHGGRIWAESDGFDEVRCPGSVFRIMLPIHAEQPPSPSDRLPGLDRVV